jgi:hypothetical protein
VWVVAEGLLPARIPEAEYGMFYEQDVYVALNPGDEEGSNYDIFLWLGASSDAIKRGAGAILAC